MSDNYEHLLSEHFQKLDKNNFTVNFSSKRIFVCGGKVDITAPIPPSFRDRFYTYTAKHFTDIHNSLVQAEAFKDYFKDGQYDDLLVFEDDIAKISTLVLIFLESPGSLVELGMFVSKKEVYKKLLVIAADNHVETEDSFIFLGPLSFLAEQELSSYAVYPFPNPGESDYDEGHLKDLCSDVENKLSNSLSTEKFNEKNSSHNALLICEIITHCYPIQIKEIEIALLALDISLPKKMLSRCIYLSLKLGFIQKLKYGTHNYYYPQCSLVKLKFGQTRDQKSIDNSGFRITLIQSFIDSHEHSSRKRNNALKNINQKRGEI